VTQASLPAVPQRPAVAGTPAWRRNAVAVPPAPGGVPRIAIVIDDLGPNLRGSQAIIALPAPLTLAFLPYADVTAVCGSPRRPRICAHADGAGGPTVDLGPGALRVARAGRVAPPAGGGLTASPAMSG
jgi:hypothetical protein